jgi:uncharacterized membrane protein (DUF485 family)
MPEKNQLYHTSAFQKLLRKKKVFILCLTLFFFSYFLLLPILTSYLPSLMTYKVYGDLTFAWIFAFSQFIMTGAISYIYYKKAKSFDATVERIKNEYIHGGNES